MANQKVIITTEEEYIKFLSENPSGKQKAFTNGVNSGEEEIIKIPLWAIGDIINEIDEETFDRELEKIYKEMANKMRKNGHTSIFRTENQLKG
jgi:hypothetical protein